MNVVFVHGYNVTSTRTYGVLPQRLKSLGHHVSEVYLSKYITLDDDLTLDDVVKAFHAALIDTFGPQFEKKKFACITHSTGGLVVRSWISRHYQHRQQAIPLSHLIMLAPPTHGSRLSSLGKSRLSRIRNLWGLEPGVKILDALTLGSQFQWELNSAWIKNRTHMSDHFFPFVITGQWIDKKLWDVIIPATYERGSDGVVRVSSANLNMQKFVLSPQGNISSERIKGVAFLVTPKTAHADVRYGVMAGVPPKGEHVVLSAIDQALRVDSRAAYRILSERWLEQTQELQQHEPYHDGTPLDRYSQLIFRVYDSQGNFIPDYAIELINHQGRGDQLPVGFLSHSFELSQPYPGFVMYLNHTQLGKVAGGKVGFRIQSVPHSFLVQYEEVIFLDDLAQVSRYLQPNQTTYVEVHMKRKINKNTFRLTKNLSYQKIRPKPSDYWIE